MEVTGVGAGRQRGKKVSMVWKVKEAGLGFSLKNYLGWMERPHWVTDLGLALRSLEEGGIW